MKTLKVFHTIQIVKFEYNKQMYGPKIKSKNNDKLTFPCIMSLMVNVIVGSPFISKLLGMLFSSIVMSLFFY